MADDKGALSWFGRYPWVAGLLFGGATVAAAFIHAAIDPEAANTRRIVGAMIGIIVFLMTVLASMGGSVGSRRHSRAVDHTITRRQDDRGRAH